MTDTPMMGCGHSANAKKDDGSPCCAICSGHDPGACIVADPPYLAGRMARCNYGPHKDVQSNVNLAFFEYQPMEKTDAYYCGCWGWN